ncbi:MAG: DNA glycosylase [Opitutales bacterium]
MDTPPEATAFTPWRSLGKGSCFTESSLAETLDGGQSFRWRRNENGFWQGAWNSHLVELRLTGDFLQWRAPRQLPVDHKEVVRYLALDFSYEDIINELPWRSDPILAEAIQCFRGLRILRQPLGETLFAFLLSSVKSIPQIKELCFYSAQKYGDELVPGIHALPTWERLAEVSEADLRILKFGYRAKYVSATAKRLVNEPDFLSKAEAAPYEEARSRLMELPGVGGKIADCALLFGAGKLEAFPVDTWIAKALAARYELDDLGLDQLAAFGRTHFGRHAGLAQQFLFSAERRSVRLKED